MVLLSLRNLKLCSGVESLSLTSPIFHESFPLIPGFFPLKTKKYLHRHPVGLLIGIYLF